MSHRAPSPQRDWEAVIVILWYGAGMRAEDLRSHRRETAEVSTPLSVTLLYCTELRGPGPLFVVCECLDLDWVCGSESDV